MGSIRILEEAVARKIAAGEVIDRPLSVVRELLDNAIDAGATEISCHVEGGGIRRIRVTDNGRGMSRDDLSLSILPHATSKITSEEDLYRLKTLGFRGEALASIAACSRLEITTSLGGTGDKLTVHGGSVLALESTAARKGTIVDVGDLFWSMPARRKFLKRNATESQLCRKHFIEKALPFNQITFRYFNDDVLELFLPASELKERFMACFPGEMNLSLLRQERIEREGLSVVLVAGLPGLHKKNRSLMPVYVNNRRIDEYALVQSVQYAYAPWLPGGLFPVCAVFLEIPPDEVDFNVHPAKREARFRDLQGIHHFLTGSLQQLLQDQRGSAVPVGKIDRTAAPKSPETAEFPDFQNHSVVTGLPPVYPVYRPLEEGQLDQAAERDRFAPESQTVFRYLGQVFRCFLLAEKGDTLYLVDQHAAHERILYDRLVAAPPAFQSLLVPLDTVWEKDEESLLIRCLGDFERAGFRLKKKGAGIWTVNAVPALLSGTPDKGLEIIRESLADRDNVARALFSRIACRTAVKEGDILDDVTARRILTDAFALPEPRCPHGRPVWFRLSQRELEGLVGRIIT